jgi:hypothetical protein
VAADPSIANRFELARNLCAEGDVLRAARHFSPTVKAASAMAARPRAIIGSDRNSLRQTRNKKESGEGYILSYRGKHTSKKHHIALQRRKEGSAL